LSETRLRLVLVAGATALLPYRVLKALRYGEPLGGPLWDLDVYRLAASRWAAGLDPYWAGGETTGYIYSPSITPLMTAVFRDFGAELAYLVVMVAAVVATVLLLFRSLVPAWPPLWLCGVYAVAFGSGEIPYLLLTGNLAWFAGILAAVAIAAGARGRWSWFYVLVGLIALVKPYLLALLVVPLALRRISPWAALAAAPLAIDALLTAYLWPGLAASRALSVGTRVIESMQLGYSLSGRFSRVLERWWGMEPVPATVLAGLAQVAVAALVIILVRRRGADPRAPALAVVAAFALVPRMGGYDAFLFGPAFMAGLWPARHARLAGASALGGGVVLAGLFKEGLALLPVLTALALWRRDSAARAD